ncbi:MAG: DNA topoisomerase 4 subunit A [Synechococcus sp. SB0666_bin_14]|nr:DNA topoisomerase 4 subunit A [Synechococcus sp. SB0666_bin_14]MYA91401.1 DNA topoisomerase 4 subunit A [Synechococcus sp. SB0663_bin_10]MYG47523.1 DNA topoisomerase 4 subunit A [Synechococcus sp. SB0675_bin_6]MYJ59872.1 DNA topoisomerase 4 subunit A [Synechococcus sp. SB0672_bin_6]MYK91382.1 DNA topoisomerase 4 subunit A [Synechococcus sp. SB0669_bin_8]
MVRNRIVPTSLREEMERSYLEYAMSVIVGRALPDVRDGLKPVQRRILYAMHELGLTPERPFRKCARVVGDVLGKYHPHGETAVYDALVRQVQTFTSRYPLLQGHGNFGSVDDDPPAAMRYTETRLAPLAHGALLGELAEDTVDFTPNFDGAQQEPAVLPAQLPLLLLNGCTGIAVGMATNIPPHNLGEVVDGLVALLRNPRLSDEALLQLIPGPDFPTGGEIPVGQGLYEAYMQGRGSIPVRGVAHLEAIQPGKGRRRRNAVVVTELPYQLSKASWIEKLAEQVNDGRLSGIADIRDESDRDGMRVVIELRRDGQPKVVLQELFRRTALQNNFGAILLALVDGQPTQLSLRRVLEIFLEFRERTTLRRYRFALSKISRRLEVVKGLLQALTRLQEVILLISQAPEAARAAAALQVQLGLSPAQAEAVLAMPLRRLTGLERQGLDTERQELEAEQARLQVLLDDRNARVKALIRQLEQLRKRYGTPRRTRLLGQVATSAAHTSTEAAGSAQHQATPTTLPEDGLLLVQGDGQLRLASPLAVSRLKLEQPAPLASQPPPLRCLVPVHPEPRIVVFSTMGRIANLRWERIGPQPQDLAHFLPEKLGGQTDHPVQLVRLGGAATAAGLALLSCDGHCRWLKATAVLESAERARNSGRTVTLLKLRPGRTLCRVAPCPADMAALVVATSCGRLLRLDATPELLQELDSPAGAPLLRLLPHETIVGAAWCGEASQVLLATRRGQLKRLPVDRLAPNRRGDLGQIGLRFLERSDSVLGLWPVGDCPCFTLVTTDHRSGRFPWEQAPVQECSGVGACLLPAGAALADVIIPGETAQIPVPQ